MHLEPPKDLEIRVVEELLGICLVHGLLPLFNFWHPWGGGLATHSGIQGLFLALHSENILIWLRGQYEVLGIEFT